MTEALEKEIKELKQMMLYLCKWGMERGTWASEDISNQYYSVQGRMNEVRDRLLLIQKNQRIDKKVEKSDFQIMTEKASIREAQVTSSTYERSQKRLFKEVDGMLCGR